MTPIELFGKRAYLSAHREIELEQKGMTRTVRSNGKPRIFCKPKINKSTKSYLDPVIYNTEIEDSDPVIKTKSFKPYLILN